MEGSVARCSMLIKGFVRVIVYVRFRIISKKQRNSKKQHLGLLGWLPYTRNGFYIGWFYVDLCSIFAFFVIAYC